MNSKSSSSFGLATAGQIKSTGFVLKTEFSRLSLFPHKGHKPMLQIANGQTGQQGWQARLGKACEQGWQAKLANKAGKQGWYKQGWYKQGWQAMLASNAGSLPLICYRGQAIQQARMVAIPYNWPYQHIQDSLSVVTKRTLAAAQTLSTCSEFSNSLSVVTERTLAATKLRSTYTGFSFVPDRLHSGCSNPGFSAGRGRADAGCSKAPINLSRILCR